MLPQFHHVPPIPPAESHRRPFAVSGRPVQEAGAGQLPLALRRARFMTTPSAVRCARAHTGDLRLRLADLLRFQRLHRHGPRRRENDGLQPHAQFQQSLPATGLGEFWSRWHISLSTWFRDYVYIPLGGNRGGTFLTYRNLFITFLISGIWHGAAWTFVIWGVLHALGVMLTRELERSAFYRERVPALVKQTWRLRLRLLRLDFLPRRHRSTMPC